MSVFEEADPQRTARATRSSSRPSALLQRVMESEELSLPVR